jgi:hypothetical protein
MTILTSRAQYSAFKWNWLNQTEFDCTWSIEILLLLSNDYNHENNINNNINNKVNDQSISLDLSLFLSSTP